MLLRLLILAATLCLALSSMPQTQLIQRLREDIYAATPGANKLKATLAFCDAWESYSPDTLYKYAELAAQLAASQNDAHAELLCDYYKAVWLFQVNKLDSAMNMTDVLIKKYTSAYPYDDMYLKLYGLRGNILTRTARMDELMAHNFSLLQLTGSHSDTLGMARATIGIGNVKMKLKSYDEALQWYHNALALMKRPEFRRKLSFLFNNMAITFFHLNDQDSAEYYVKQGLHYSREDQNLTNLANSLFVYGGFMSEFHRLKEAEAAFREAVEVRRQIGDIYYLITDMGQVALFYANNNEPQKGIALCKEALDLAAKNGQSYGNIDALYEVLGKNYQVAGDHKSYSEILQKQLHLKDSAYKINTSEEIAKLQTRYELQKKENTIIQQKLDLTRKNYLFFGSVLLSLAMVAAGVIIFRNYRKREKRHAALAVKEAGEQERVRIAADLHDNLGAYAASMASNVDSIRAQGIHPAHDPMYTALKSNSISIISELNDTIWVLKKDSLSLTAISDRIKVFISRIRAGYPNINIDVEESIAADYLLSSAHAFHLYRVMQEAVNNALRHSRATDVLVSIISSSGGKWEVAVTDNGTGMRQAEGSGNGLANMRNRSREAGWNIEWINNGNGTTLKVSGTTN